MVMETGKSKSMRPAWLLVRAFLLLHIMVNGTAKEDKLALMTASLMYSLL